MAGKTVLITGANSGIGLATATSSRNVATKSSWSAETPIEPGPRSVHIHDLSNGPSPSLFLADLSSQDEIHALVVKSANDSTTSTSSSTTPVPASEPRAHRRWHRANLRYQPPRAVPTTTLLLDQLKQSHHGRVVTVGSESYAHKLDFDNLQGELDYGFMSVYKRSKLANILFTFELARRLEGSTVTANCASPGPI